MLYTILLEMVDDNSVIKKNTALNNVKENSWVGHLSNNTKEIDFLRKTLKDMLNDDIDTKDKLDITKQLAMLEKSRIDVGKHLDMVMLKKAEIMANKTVKKKKEVVNLWSRE